MAMHLSVNSNVYDKLFHEQHYWYSCIRMPGPGIFNPLRATLDVEQACKEKYIFPLNAWLAILDQY